MDIGEFSGAVRISPISDFITPSQQCIIPLMDKKESGQQPIEVRLKPRQSKGIVKINTQVEGIPLKPETQSVKISLNDCLACSGCITTAESILVQEQSHTVFRDISNKKLNGQMDKVLIISISPQSLSSIANKHRLSLREARVKLAIYLKKLGVDYILDTNFCRTLSLMAMTEEFESLMREKMQPKTANECEKSSECCGNQCSSHNSTLPLFSSVCPGWICYVEKSHGQLLIPHLSRVRSPQAIAGSLVKHFLPKKLGLEGKGIFHISVMPCFDKKLEASRPDLRVPGTEERQVDCVVSTRELELMLIEDGAELCNVESNVGDPTQMYLFDSVNECGQPLGHPGSGSGGYAYTLFMHAANKIFNVDASQIQFRTVRNKDWQEITLEVDGKPVLSAAVLNGFRHIQNLVQKIKKNNLKYDFVEVMACPSGCLNGGGQLAPESSADKSNFLQNVETLYKSARCDTQALEAWPHINSVIREWLGDLNSVDAKTHLFTQFHVVESTVAMKW